MKGNIIVFSKKFKMVYLILAIACFFSINEIYMPSSLNEALMQSTFGRMFPIFIFIILSTSTYKLMVYYNKNYISFLRFKSKEEYIEKLTSYIFVNLCFVYLIAIIIIILFSLIYNLMYDYLLNFSFIEFIYYIYTTIKMYVIYWLIIKISIIIYKGYSVKISALFLILMLALKESFRYSIRIISTIREIPLFFGYYLSPMPFSNIFLDIFGFLLQIIILSLLGDILKKIIIKYKKIYIEE